MKKILTDNSGITLIALVITIIVLLILAGVSISMLTGDNGILTQATEAKKANTVGEEKEQIGLAMQSLKMKKQADNVSTIVTPDELQKQLIADGAKNVTVESGENDNLVVKYQDTKNQYTVNQNGDIGENGQTPGTPNPEEPNDKQEIPTSESYVGYYADIEGDGTVDGIIYADLAIGGSGSWNDDSGSNYEYAQETEGLKSYYVSSENGTGFANWEKPVITAIEGTTGKDRFYVMALEDFTPGKSYYWYNGEYNSKNPVENTFNDFGQGKTNTTTIIGEWNKEENIDDGAQDIIVMWEAIQKADDAGKTWDLSKWFVPSKAEWSAFLDMIYTKMGVAESNYRDYGFKESYWSSTQQVSPHAYAVGFFRGYLDYNTVFNNYSVRFSATF